MTGSKSINTFSGGMNLDADKSLLKDNQYRYAENIRTVSNEGATSGALTNIEGSSIVSGFSIDGHTIIGTCTIRDIGIIFTEFSVGEFISNQIFKLEFQDDGSVSTTAVLGEPGVFFNIPQDGAISFVGRYEDSTTIKLYWADGVNYIRSINIAADNSMVSDSSFFDMAPSSSLSQPEIVGIGTGRLNAGVIQYCYQLYNNSGSETTLSPVSSPVHLSESSLKSNSSDYLGSSIGSIYGEPTGKSVKVKINVGLDSQFSRARLISIYYFNYGDSPIITVVNDSLITPSSEYIYFEDGGTSAIGELTVEEFNLIGKSLIKPLLIEEKENILFAANSSSDTFDIDYDTRAFQFKSVPVITTIPASPYVRTLNATTSVASLYVTLEYDGVLSSYIGIGDKFEYTISGYHAEYTITDINDSTNIITLDRVIETGLVPIGTPTTITQAYTSSTSYVYSTKLHNSDGTSNDFTYDELDTVPLNHDCIHSEIYEEDSYNNVLYRYNKDGKFGGSGLNVSYLYANTYFIESYSDYWDTSDHENTWLDSPAKRFIDQRTPRIGDRLRSISDIKIKDSNGDSSDISLSSLGISSHSGYLNYANQFLSNRLSSYHRDEIYRFAAVFYDGKGRRSPAHWIADIRFPAGYMYDSDWTASSFEMPIELDSTKTPYAGTFLEKQELLVKPLGIKFSFSNLNTIADVRRIEIVRAKRDINNKTIYGQGAVQKVGTQEIEYFNSAKDIIFGNYVVTKDAAHTINNGIVGSLRPHPLMAMGYTYSICGPYMDSNINQYNNLNTINSSSEYGSNNALSFNYYHTTGGAVGIRNPISASADSDKPVFAAGNYNVQKPCLLDHAASPYFYNKDYILFVSPETSYYGVDYTEQLKSNIGNASLSIVDVVSPVTTPVVTNVSSRSAYIGNINHDRVIFDDHSAGTNPFPSAMYIGADISPKMKVQDISVTNSTAFHTLGMAGVYAWHSTDALVPNSNPRLVVGNNTPDTAIGDVHLDQYALEEPSYRAYVSLGGIVAADTAESTFVNYKHASGGARNGLFDQFSQDPMVLADFINDDNRPGMTVKYFSGFNKKATGHAYGGNSIDLIYQLGDMIVSGTNGIGESQVPTVGSIGPMNSGGSSFDIDSFEYSGSLAPGKNISGYNSDYVSIGGRLYLNYSKALTFGDGASGDNGDKGQASHPNVISKTKASGVHGAGIIMSFSNHTSLPSIGIIDKSKRKFIEYSASEYIDGTIQPQNENIDKILSSQLATYIVNIKSKNSAIYGGKSIIDRQYTEYISTGSVIEVDSATKESIVFGGDTFIGILDYTVTYATDPIVDNSAMDSNSLGNLSTIKLSQVKHIGAMLPLESSVNTHLVTSKTYSTDDSNFIVQKEVGVYGPAISAGSTWTRTQSLPQYRYNSAYSSELSSIGFSPKLITEEANLSFDCRVYSSEVKTNNELSDSWSKFKALNYIDVDTRHGEITKLKTFKSRLYFWQKSAFGVLSVNDRSLVTDSNSSQLALGTSGILSRFDYISTSNGFKRGITSGLTESESSLYWFDIDNSQMCSFEGALGILSKAKGVQSIFNLNKDNFTKNIPMIFDKKYNEVLLTLYGLQGVDSIS